MLARSLGSAQRHWAGWLLGLGPLPVDNLPVLSVVAARLDSGGPEAALGRSVDNFPGLSVPAGWLDFGGRRPTGCG